MTVDFAHRMFEAARTGNSALLLQAVDAGLPVDMTNDKGLKKPAAVTALPRNLIVLL